MSRDGSDTRRNESNKSGSKSTNQSKAIMPRGSREAATVPNRAREGGAVSNRQTETMIVPKGYTMRKIEPAKNYDVISMARAMNADFGPKVKKLFDIEREAALEAAETGVYIGWRCPEYTWDCQRVGRSSRCFCGHALSQHEKYNGNSVRVPCKQAGCRCKAYAWMAARPEEIGEFWFARRRDFDVSTWRAKCRCKHTHEEHDPNGLRGCKLCRCGAFDSSFLCAACDKHWEEHETFFDTTASRKEKNMPYGADYLPFSEIPSLRNMVLTGEDDGDMSYMRLQDKLGQPPSNHRAIDNGSAFPAPGGLGARGSGRAGGKMEGKPPRRDQSSDDDERGGKGGGRSAGFKPTYD